MSHVLKATAGAALAMCLGFSVSAQAQSSVSVYGLIDLSAGSFQNAGTTKVKRLDSGNMSTSYLGFKGTEDLGGGLKAGFTLESFFLADSGGASRVPGVDVFWARSANVSLSGDFGSVRIGRSGPPLFVSTLLFNPFGDSFGYSPAIRQWYNAPYGKTSLVGDSGWNNAINYGTPNFSGLSANIAVAAGEGATNARGPNIGANILYFGGPLALTVAAQKVEAQGVLGRGIAAFPGFENQTAFQFGGSYDFGVAKVFGQYGQVKTDATLDTKVKTYQIGASAPLGAGSLMASYGNSKIDDNGAAADTTSKILTLGYDYNLSKRTKVYAVYMNDKYTNLSSGNTYAVGLLHKF